MLNISNCDTHTNIAHLFIAQLILDFRSGAVLSSICILGSVSNSYNMDARALAYLLHEGAKRPRAINELSA